MKQFIIFLFIVAMPFLTFAEAGKAIGDEILIALLLIILIPIIILLWIYYLIWKKCKSKFRLFYLLGIPLFLFLMFCYTFFDFFPILPIFLAVLILLIGIIDVLEHIFKKK